MVRGADDDDLVVLVERVFALSGGEVEQLFACLDLGVREQVAMDLSEVDECLCVFYLWVADVQAVYAVLYCWHCFVWFGFRVSGLGFRVSGRE